MRGNARPFRHRSPIVQKAETPGARQSFQLSFGIVIEFEPPKPKKPPDDPASYRPIGLLSVRWKSFEAAVLEKIVRAVDSKLPPSQVGSEGDSARRRPLSTSDGR